jgi:hypothetical protein
MRPRPQRGLGWRKEGQLYILNRFSPEHIFQSLSDFYFAGILIPTCVNCFAVSRISNCNHDRDQKLFWKNQGSIFKSNSIRDFRIKIGSRFLF